MRYVRLRRGKSPSPIFSDFRDLLDSSGAFYTTFAQRKYGNGKRIISFPFPFPRGCMFYTFSGAEEIGNGNSASSSRGFTDASRSRHFCGRTIHTVAFSPACAAQRS
jgi:hypothetical protein